MKKGVFATSEEFSACCHIMFISIKKISPPAVIDDEVCRHALSSASRTDLHGLTGLCRHKREDVKQYPVLLKLRVFAESDFLPLRQVTPTSRRKLSILIH